MPFVLKFWSCKFFHHCSKFDQTIKFNGIKYWEKTFISCPSSNFPIQNWKLTRKSLMHFNFARFTEILWWFLVESNYFLFTHILKVRFSSFVHKDRYSQVTWWGGVVQVRNSICFLFHFDTCSSLSQFSSHFQNLFPS